MKKIHSKIAPQQLISDKGKPDYGYFDGPVDSLAVENFNYYTDMDTPASALSKYFHFKQFQFISLVTENFIIGVAIADIRYAGNGFCYLYDIKNNKLIETTWLKPLGFGYQLTSSPMNGVASIGGKKDNIKFKIKNKRINNFS